MRSNVAAALQPTQSNTVGRGSLPEKARAAKVGLGLPVEPTSANSREVPVIPTCPALALIDEARVLANLSQEAMASYAGVNKGTFSQGLRDANGKSFNAKWLDGQPIEFWMALWTLIGRKFGFTTVTNAELILTSTEQTLAGIHQLLRNTLVSVGSEK